MQDTRAVELVDRRRERVAFTTELRERVKAMLEEMQRYAARGYTPSGSRRDRASEEPKQPNKPSRRGVKKRGMLMGIIIAVAVLIVLALVLILTLGQRAPAHMLPKVTPPETAADVSTGADA